MEVRLLTILTLLIILNPISLVYAVSSPTLLEPINNSNTSSTTLKWQSVEGASRYKIVVDDEPTASSPYFKPIYYTTNTQYSPQLPVGIYYWKVAAEDSSNSWSNWSDIWSFTYSTNPSPSTTDPTPTATPTPSSLPSTNPSSTFLISNIPSNITSIQSISITIDLNLPQSPNSTFYLKGAFKKADSSNYFGLTKVGSSWVANGSSYSNQLSVTTDSLGSWKGNIEVKVDTEDSGFTSTGSYLFKVGRYTSSGGGPVWSNEVTININNVETKSPTSATSKPKSTETPTTKSVLGSSIVYPSKPKVNSATTSGQPLEATPSSESASFNKLETSSPSPTPETKVQSIFQFNPTVIIGLAFVLGGIGYLVFLKFKN